MLIVYVDGLCEPRNPGGVGAYGFIVYENSLSGETKVVHRACEVIGSGPSMSNNVAEYTALEKALLFLTDRSHERIEVKGDSKLVINQMAGLWSMHGGLYTPVYERVKKLIRGFHQISFTWVPREYNGEADALSRVAYEGYCTARGIEARYHRH